MAVDLTKEIGNKITIKMIADGMGALQRNGYDLVCPIIPPIQVRQPAPSNQIIGGQQQIQIALQKSSCNTNCPLMIVNKNSVDVCCGSIPINYVVEKVFDLLENANTNLSKSKEEPKIIPFGNQGGQA